VVNFAALGMVAESWRWPLDYYRTNVLGNVALHEGLRWMKGLRKYVHVSTPEVYGNTSGLVGEDAPLNPTTPYAASRAACDLHLQTFLRQYDFPVVWTRAANVFGPGQLLYRIVPRTLLSCRLGQKLPLHGGGHSVRSFIHIRDVCRATLTLALDGRPGRIYHLSTRRTQSIRELVNLCCQIAGRDPGEVIEVTEDRPGKDPAYLLDSSRMREDHDWSDGIELETGIGETLAWVDRHLDAFASLSPEYQHQH
jgi:dTDP-glucose 4,6-dehydratase